MVQLRRDVFHEHSHRTKTPFTVGFAKDTVNLKDYADLSMLKEALARLK
jgi:hypothetical protein